MSVSRFNPSTYMSGLPGDVPTPGIGHHMSVGRVVQVFPNKFMANVAISAGYNKGGTFPCHFRCLQRDYTHQSGVVFVPEENDLVYVDWRYGPIPQITDYVPQTIAGSDFKNFLSTVTPIRSLGGEDPVYKTNSLASHKAGPSDLMPGDKIIMGKKGNFLGILSGGLSILRGGHLSQIILSKIGDAVKIVSRRFELISDFGLLRFNNDKGAASVELLGNDSDVESNQHSGNWKYQIVLGAEKFFYANFGGLFNFFVNRDGSFFLKAQRAHLEIAEPPVVNYRGGTTTTTAGSASRVIDGDDYKDTKGTVTEKMAKKIAVCVGPSNSLVGGFSDSQYRDAKRELIAGPPLVGLSTAARETIIEQGDYAIKIGVPPHVGIPTAALAAQLKMGDYSLMLAAGDVSQTILTKGNFSRLTPLGDMSDVVAVGNYSAYIGAGQMSLNVGAGTIDVSSAAGNVSMGTLLGNAYFGTKVGNTTIEALAGSISLKAGTAEIVIGPAGIKIQNGLGAVELLDLLIKLSNYLATAQTPGYGGPLSTASVIAGEIMTSLTLVKGP